MAMPRAALLFLLALLLHSSSARSQNAPIPLLRPPLAPSQPPSADTALSPPETSSESPAPAHLPPSLHSTAPSPAPAADEDDDNKDKDDAYKEKEHSSPAPAPSVEDIKAGTGGEQAVDSERHEGEMNGGKKAGVVVGAFAAAAVVGLAAVIWRKRQANSRRSRYADYSARLELA